MSVDILISRTTEDDGVFYDRCTGVALGRVVHFTGDERFEDCYDYMEAFQEFLGPNGYNASYLMDPDIMDRDLDEFNYEMSKLVRCCECSELIPKDDVERWCSACKGD